MPRSKQLIIWNFICSILLVIAFVIYRLIDASDDPTYAMTRAFPRRSLLGLLMLSLMEACLLALFIWREHWGTDKLRVCAGAFGFVGLIFCLIVHPLNVNIYGGAMFTWRAFGVLYVSSSHLLYALFGKENA